MKREKLDRLPQENEKSKEYTNQQADRCHKCGDTPHIEGFRCPTSRHQCKHCNKIGHFSHQFSKRNKKVHTRKVQETQRHTN